MNTYIGARYVPIFGRKDEESIQWDNTKPYEPLTIVLYQGDSYTSRQHVPAGIEITNEDYWALTGNYNAQIEQYRQEVFNYDDRITANANAIADEVLARENADEGLADDISYETEARQNADTGLQDQIDAITANNWVTSARVADGAIVDGKLGENSVGYANIKDGAVSPSKLNPDTIKRFWARNLSIEGTNLVVFGDSYTQDNIANSINAYWPKRVNTVLGTNLFNFAIAGAGFGRTEQLISTQQTNCQNSMSTAQAENTSTVICLAGCNDLLNDIPVADINSGITNFLNWASNFFPYADIYVVPYNWGFGGLTAAQNALITNSLNSIMTYSAQRIHIIPYAWTWNLGIASRFQNAVHPNMSGYNQIAARILAAMNGVEAGAFNTGNHITLSNSPYLQTGYLNYNCRDGVLYINGYIRPANAGAQSFVIYAENHLPAITTPNDSVFVLQLIDSTTHAYAGLLNFKKNGGLNANLVANVGVNDVLAFNGAFIPEVGVDWSDYN